MLLADLKADIHQIHHERTSKQVPIYATGTELILETRGSEHLKEIRLRLRESGYDVQALD
ncbi:MAG: hypothetical protein V1798_06335 [Pseudomonadota bacterium]